MKDKKGFIRILEVIFAIMLITGAVLILVSNNLGSSDISDGVHEKQRYILEVVANDEEMREEIINFDPDGNPPKLLTETNTFIEKNIPSTWSYVTCVTDIDNICSGDTPNDKNLYVSESIISSSRSKYTNSKKLRFFIWRD